MYLSYERLIAYFTFSQVFS